MILKKHNKNILFISFFSSIFMTIIPTFSNINLPLDTIEALAWEVI